MVPRWPSRPVSILLFKVLNAFLNYNTLFKTFLRRWGKFQYMGQYCELFYKSWIKLILGKHWSLFFLTLKKLFSKCIYAKICRFNKKKMFKRVVGIFFRKKWTSTSKAIVLEKYWNEKSDHFLFESK